MHKRIIVADPKWAKHKADPSRAQDDLSNGFGMEDRGVPREWNDEYQCLLELPNDTPDLVCVWLCLLTVPRTVPWLLGFGSDWY